jgi:hypothetical protein
VSHDPSSAPSTRTGDLSLPARQGGEATWPTSPDGTAPPRGLGSWPVSPPEPVKRRHPRADLVVAAIMVIALLAVAGLYVAGVLEREGSQGAPTAPAQSTPTPSSTAPPTPPANPFAP